MLLWVCTVTEQGRCQNVVSTSVTHLPVTYVLCLCTYHILTSSVIYY